MCSFRYQNIVGSVGLTNRNDDKNVGNSVAFNVCPSCPTNYNTTKNVKVHKDAWLFVIQNN